MKDEEMFNEWKSEQYKDQSTEEKMEFVEHLHTFPRYFKKAFLAGLKAGRPKWHFVKNGDLPKENKKYLVLTSDGEPKVDSWLNITWVYSYDVIAWKEIIPPKEIKNEM